LHREAGKMIAAQFLRNLIAAVPYVIHTVLTGNPVLSNCRRQAVEGGIRFTSMAHHKYACHYIFDQVCDKHQIEYRLTRIKHPWANGQAERMNRTIQKAPSIATITIAMPG
jgi:hypothetical protein